MDLQELVFRKEKLCKELQNYVKDSSSFGKMIHHPLCVEMFYNPEHCGLTNYRFTKKKELLEKARKARNWSDVLVLYERAYRIGALYEFAEEMDDDVFWEMLRWVWMDTENQFQHYDELKELLTSERPGKEKLMNEEEHAFLATLPETGIRIYRGYPSDLPQKRNGMSWTLDLEKAHWFAKRLLSGKVKPIVITGLANKKDIHAYFSDRNESEIVIFSEFIYDFSYVND
jgi:hypothetical protein